MEVRQLKIVPLPALIWSMIWMNIELKKKVNYSLTLYSVYQYNVPVRISNLIIHEYLDLFYKHEVIPVTEL